ncbi:MAG: hypothetical protein AAGD25_00410 [Cyanobacteria bacterium P01_F01_bin.150]
MTTSSRSDLPCSSPHQSLASQPQVARSTDENLCEVLNSAQNKSRIMNSRATYRQRTPDDYLALLDTKIRASFSDDQLDSIRMLLASTIPKPSPKLVDLRFEIDLLLSRFYVVLFVGKDRRKKRRSPLHPILTRIGNVAIAIAILVGINLLISLGLFMFFYLVKSALNIDLFHETHLADQLERFR